ncbi:MAG: hypothetical protein ACLFSQ_06920 [Candidatus Zixiibacteriota bacterium]
MSECQNTETCPFFNDRMANMTIISKMIKKKYCLGDNTKCARWMVSSNIGNGFIPPNLEPLQVERAKKILESHGIAA